MKSADIRVGMVVAVRDERVRSGFDQMARKAQVVQTGIGRAGRSSRADSTRVHLFDLQEGATPRTVTAERNSDELREYDPNAVVPEVDRSLDWDSPEYKAQVTAAQIARNKRSAQQVVRNQQIFMPWDEYLKQLERVLALRRAEQSQRVATIEQARLRRLAIEQRLAEIGLTVLPEDAARTDFKQYDFYWNNETLSVGHGYDSAEALAAKLERLAASIRISS